jgi:hypothetical protein
MSSKLKTALETPVGITTDKGDIVMVQPRMLIRAAAEILMMLSGDQQKDIILPHEKD